MLKHLFRNIFAGALLLCCTTSCCVADWYHDIAYGDAPPPTDPIAPVGENTLANAPAYSCSQIAMLTTDSLIFFFTANGIRQPQTAYSTQSPNDLEVNSTGLRIFQDLVKNKVIVPNREKPEYVLIFSRVGQDVFQTDVAKQKAPGDFSNVIFTQQYKIKGVK